MTSQQPTTATVTTSNFKLLYSLLVFLTYCFYILIETVMNLTDFKGASSLSLSTTGTNINQAKGM